MWVCVVSDADFAVMANKMAKELWGIPSPVGPAFYDDFVATLQEIVFGVVPKELQ